MNIFTKCMIGFIKLYQLIIKSLYSDNNAVFIQLALITAIEAFRSHGTFFGFYLTIKRLLKCHPWHAGGHDPVP